MYLDRYCGWNSPGDPQVDQIELRWNRVYRIPLVFHVVREQVHSVRGDVGGR